MIKSKGRFLHNREIATILHKYESGITIDQWVEKLSAIVFKFKKEGDVAAIEVDNNKRNTFYGLPEWLDENVKIKKGFEYDNKLLMSKSKEAA